MGRSLVTIFMMLASVFAAKNADAYFELNSFYTSETMNTGSTETKSRMFIEACLGFAIDKDSRYMLGWNYGVFNTTNTATTTTTYSSTQMGPRFTWFFNKSKSWSLGVAYNIVTTANYDSGTGSSAKWTGTAIKADLGYNFALTESWLLGVRLNYSSATYVSQLVGSTTYSTTSNTALFMYPSIYTVVLF